MERLRFIDEDGELIAEVEVEDEVMNFYRERAEEEGLGLDELLVQTLLEELDSLERRSSD